MPEYLEIDVWCQIVNYTQSTVYLSKKTIKKRHVETLLDNIQCEGGTLGNISILTGSHGSSYGEHGGWSSGASSHDRTRFLEEKFRDEDLEHFAHRVDSIIDVRYTPFEIGGFEFFTPEDAIILSPKPIIVAWCKAAAIDLSRAQMESSSEMYVHAENAIRTALLGFW